MQINKKKLERQQQGVDKWFETLKGTLHYFTGVGKTFTAVLIMKRLFRLDPNHSIVILVPSEALQKQWSEVLSLNFTKKDLNTVEVFTPNYIIANDIRVRTRTLVVDEFHEFYSEEYVKTINGEYIQFDNNLALTATYEDSKNRHTDLQDLYPIIDEITEEEAIKEGYITSYVEFNLAVELTEEEQAQYNSYTKVISDNMSKFGKGGLNLATKCLQGGKHTNGRVYEGKDFVYGWAKKNGWHRDLNPDNPRDKEINDLWNPSKVFGYAINLMNAIRKRKDLLYHCNSKAGVCADLVFKFYNLKTIIFSQSTAFADKLNLLLNDRDANSSVVYHSQLKTILAPSPKTGKLIKFGSTRLKKQAMEAIKTNKARILCTASSLDKGLDIPDLVFGITASGTSNFTQYKQRKGRNLRLFGEDKVALLVNLYVKGSKEEDWLTKRQSKTNHKIHWVTSIDEISFSPKEKKGFKITDI